MEYIYIRYPESRSVYADEKEIGRTNIILRIMEGDYTFNLGTPLDYIPTSRTVSVKDGSTLHPVEIEFKRRNS